MRHKLIGLGLVVIMAGLGLSALGADKKVAEGSQAGELLRNAYLAVVDAEMARSEQRIVDATAAYRRALGLYGRLQAEYPGWQAPMVNYRVAECQNELGAMESPWALESGTNSVLTANSETNDTVRLQGLLQELREAQGAMMSDREKGSQSVRKQREEETSRLKDELDDTVKANQALLRKVARLEARLNRSGALEGTNMIARAVVAAVKSESRRLMQDNKNSEAIALLREASDLIPTESDLLIQLSVAYCRAAEFASAVTVLAPFDVKRPTHADALLTLGTAYMGMGRIGEARVATEKALKINPDSPEVNYNMAQILISLFPPEVMDSQQHYRRALELGMAPDPEFENTLRTALIIARLKNRPSTSRSTKVQRGSTPARAIPFSGDK
jgi:tetratricopeptide (TPR) repeat protein